MRRPRVRTLLFGGALLALLAYAGALTWLRLNEDALLFHPDRGTPAPPPPALGLPAKDVTIRNAEGIDLVARIIRPPGERKGAPWILYFHGNTGNVGTPGYNDAWSRFHRLGLGVLAIDYRGFGTSGGRPSEAGLYRDADAAYAHLTTALGVPSSHVVLYGYSLGSAVAIDLATRVPAAALIVEGAFLSVPDRAAELYPWVPVRLLARNRFASNEKIASVAMPKLFIHARGDRDVPIEHGRGLYELARGPKTFQAVEGGHRDAYRVDPAFFTGLSRFLAQLGLVH